MWKLYLDDLRSQPTVDYVIARNVQEAISLIESKGFPSHISFDHDLGIDEGGEVLESGYDVAKWIVSADQWKDRNFIRFCNGFNHYTRKSPLIFNCSKIVLVLL